MALPIPDLPCYALFVFISFSVFLVWWWILYVLLCNVWYYYRRNVITIFSTRSSIIIIVYLYLSVYLLFSNKYCIEFAFHCTRETNLVSVSRPPWPPHQLCLHPISLDSQLNGSHHLYHHNNGGITSNTKYKANSPAIGDVCLLHLLPWPALCVSCHGRPTYTLCTSFARCFVRVPTCASISLIANIKCLTFSKLWMYFNPHRQ